MNALIRELKDEHKAILDVLEQVRELGISSPAGREKLLAARDLLMVHMRKEDEQYYPALRTAAAGRNELGVMMDYFLADMEAVSRKAMQVFDKYAQGGDDGQFAGEIKLLYMLLRDRVRTEEQTLFEKFPGKGRRL